MSIAVLVITDGRRDYLARTVASAMEQLHGPVTEWWMYDDTGDPHHRADLASAFPTFRHINAGPRQGFGGAIAAAWERLSADSRADWIAHLEQDFTFNRPVSLADMATVLHCHPHLVQMALRRQPWNDAEHAAGGIVEQHPGAYTERRDEAGRVWLDHRLFFTTNPCVYRRDLCKLGWPRVRHSEGEFTHHLLRNGVPGVAPSDLRFGFWGPRSDPPWVEHIGHQRAGTGY